MYLNLRVRQRSLFGFRPLQVETIGTALNQLDCEGVYVSIAVDVRP